MAPLTFGTRLDMGIPDYEELSRHAKLAEKYGYDAVWVRDHVSLEQVTGDPNCLECWTVMTALARDTSTIKIGSLVLCTPLRNPALLAKMASTFDILSHGRLILGMGAGHTKSEFDEYGYEFPRPGDRVRMLAEACQIIRLMWTEHRPTFEGKFFQIHNALNEPKPVQKPTPPIMIGAAQPRALKVVAQYADIWNSSLEMETYFSARETLAQHCRDIGRDPASIKHILHLQLIVDRSEAAAKARLEKVLEVRTGQQYLRERIITGTPEQVAERVKPLLDLGVRDFLTAFWEADRQAECIQEVGEELIPYLNQMAG